MAAQHWLSPVEPTHWQAGIRDGWLRKTGTRLAKTKDLSAIALNLLYMDSILAATIDKLVGRGVAQW